MKELKQNEATEQPVVDKSGFARRWLFSKRHIDGLLAQGLPHLKCGQRRVRIVVSEGDRWMMEKFGTRRAGKVGKPTQPAPAAV